PGQGRVADLAALDHRGRRRHRSRDRERADRQAAQVSLVDDALVYFDLPCAAAPASFDSPFDVGEPHPLARRAADELIALLRGRAGRAALEAQGGGKMFGVLFVAREGRLAYLRGFSGMLDGAWHVAGFVPPLFDAAARDAFWPAGERRLAELDD